MQTTDQTLILILRYNVATVDTLRRELCRLRPRFFGLTSDYMEKIYETFFYLKNNFNWTFIELYNLPIGLRTWFVKKYSEMVEEQNSKNNVHKTT